MSDIALLIYNNKGKNMQLSNKIKTRFSKDFKMPFQVVQEPIFSYYIDTLDAHFDTKNKLEMLYEVIETLGGEEEFFKESNRVKDTLIQDIQKSSAYERLNNDKLDDYNTVNQIKQQDIYHLGNADKTFISIDLKHANFNVFKMYDNEFPLGYDDYESLIGYVSNFEYFKKSKYLRQVIFGNMLPKKQQRLQKWTIDQVISVLHHDIGIPLNSFVSASADEVVFLIENDKALSMVDLVNKKLGSNRLTEKMSDWCRVEAFILRSIENNKFFVKEKLDDSNIEFKGIPSYFFMQAYKKYTNQEILETDKVFYFDGMLATFNKCVFDSDFEINLGE